jgi:Reverse transcriptase (RNA-dependent DNA polymerase)
MSSKKQYGFIKGRSTVLQLLKVMDDWTAAIDMRYEVDVIYTNFQKAFDSVPHKRLIYKLISFGINGNILNWIKNFC